MWCFLVVWLPFNRLLPPHHSKVSDTVQRQVNSGSGAFTRNIRLDADKTHPAECLRFYTGSPRSGFTSCRTLKSESDRSPLQTCPLPISLCVINHQLNFQGFFFFFPPQKLDWKKKYIEKSLIAAPGPAAAFRCSNVSPVKFLHVEETSCGTLSGWATAVQRLSHISIILWCPNFVESCFIADVSPILNCRLRVFFTNSGV